MADPRTADSDKDGIPDTIDLDDDNDGLLDISEIAADGRDDDADRDGMPNRLDLDSDNDGILDLEESGVFLLPGIESVRVVGGRLRTPVGSNGVADFLETASDSAVGLIAPLNSDESEGDKLPDFLDLDSDNDGLPDLFEAGVPARLDANGDGRIDAAPGSVGADGILDSVQLNNDANCCDYTADGIEDITPRNTDGTDYPDFQDLDSDNDGVFDLVEAGGTDLDSNGRVDGFVDDPAAPDGVDDALALVPLTPIDHNLDGQPDLLDEQIQAPVPEPLQSDSTVTVDDTPAAVVDDPPTDVVADPPTDVVADPPPEVITQDQPPMVAVVDDPALANLDPNPVQTGLSGSGGCSIVMVSRDRSGVDPVFPGMLLCALIFLIRRQRDMHILQR